MDRLINSIQPDSVTRIQTGRFPFMHLENLNKFASAAQGVVGEKCVAQDVYDGKVDGLLSVLGLLKDKMESKSQNI